MRDNLPYLDRSSLYCLIYAFGQHRLVNILVKCHLPLPVYLLSDEKHSRCFTSRVYLPTLSVAE